MDLLQLFGNESGLDDVAAGEAVFGEGEPGDRMYVVVDGEVELSVRDTVVEVIRAGEMFGEMALIDTMPRSATARARTDCRLVGIDERRFGFLVQQTPFFALHVMRVMTRRLRAMDDTIS